MAADLIERTARGGNETRSGIDPGGGVSVMASVHDLAGEFLVRNRRMVFVARTPPELKVKDLHKGDRLHVLGIPRIDLALGSWRIKNAKTRPEVRTWNLPYEIISVGAFEDD